MNVEKLYENKDFKELLKLYSVESMNGALIDVIPTGEFKNIHIYLPTDKVPVGMFETECIHALYFIDKPTFASKYISSGIVHYQLHKIIGIEGNLKQSHVYKIGDIFESYSQDMGRHCIDEINYMSGNYYVYKNWGSTKKKIYEVGFDWNKLYYKVLSMMVKTL